MTNDVWVGCSIWTVVLNPRVDPLDLDSPFASDLSSVPVALQSPKNPNSPALKRIATISEMEAPLRAKDLPQLQDPRLTLELAIMIPRSRLRSLRRCRCRHQLLLIRRMLLSSLIRRKIQKLMKKRTMVTLLPNPAWRIQLLLLWQMWKCVGFKRMREKEEFIVGVRKGARLKEIEACLVCDARYCCNYLLKAMRSMPERSA